MQKIMNKTMQDLVHANENTTAKVKSLNNIYKSAIISSTFCGWIAVVIVTILFWLSPFSNDIFNFIYKIIYKKAFKIEKNIKKMKKNKFKKNRLVLNNKIKNENKNQMLFERVRKFEPHNNMLVVH